MLGEIQRPVGALAHPVGVAAGNEAALKQRLRLPLFFAIYKMQSRDRLPGSIAVGREALLLDVAVRDGRVKRGDLLLLEAFGGGFTWGACLLKWI